MPNQKQGRVSSNDLANNFALSPIKTSSPYRKRKYDNLKKITPKKIIKENEQDQEVKEITPQNDDHSKKSTKNRWRKKIQQLLGTKFYSIFMTLVTIYALFGDDVRSTAFNSSVDNAFYSISIVCFFLFTIEILLASISKYDYFLSFYFWLDIIATLSLIFDIGWIWDPVTGGSSVNNASQFSQLARASRGARLGTRAGRIVRIVRMMRLIRIVKLYKHAHQAIDNENSLLLKSSDQQKQRRRSSIAIQDNKVAPESRNDNQTPTSNQEDDVYPPEESKVGKKLSDLTTRRVIMLVLAMMFSVPLFTISTYKDDSNSYKIGLEIIKQYENQTFSRGFNSSIQAYIENHIDIRTPLILVNVLNIYQWQSDTDPVDLRASEKYIASLDDDKYIAIFDMRSNQQLTSGLSNYFLFYFKYFDIGLCRTFFVCFVLAAGALFFSKDANELVIAPIEAMIQKVNRIAKNPLQAAQEEENEALAMEQAREEQEKKKKKSKFACFNKSTKKKHKDEGPYETVILEQTIVKIGALLALGFGEAGAKIIADNMAKTGDVDPMIPGVKVVAIFGFCDIRQFTDTTEILQEEVMLFVNEIAEIVHGIVDKFQGAANKNIGDAFLLVWKFNDQDIIFDEEQCNLVPKNTQNVQQIADMSLISFLKIIAQIKKSHKLDKYRKRKDLNERMPNYQVKMGFGLHVGWAIGGAIGSDFKIDASYLSPNVNMASRLEGATKSYGVPLLISGELFDILTEKCQQYLRQIDTVIIKGCSDPVDLFTCDVDISTLQVEAPNKRSFIGQEKKLQKVRARVERNRLKQQAMNNQIQISNLFETDDDLLQMRKPFTQEFYDQFSLGFIQYLEGDWQLAKQELEKVMLVKGSEDHPSQSLLEFMSESNFVSPKDWDGFRILIDK